MTIQRRCPVPLLPLSRQGGVRVGWLKRAVGPSGACGELQQWFVQALQATCSEWNGPLFLLLANDVLAGRTGPAQRVGPGDGHLRISLAVWRSDSGATRSRGARRGGEMDGGGGGGG